MSYIDPVMTEPVLVDFSVSEDEEQALLEMDALATLMDSAIKIPNTPFRVGLDALLGLIPILGDTVSALISSYIISRAKKLGVPRLTLARMSANLFLDWAIGIVPLAGDIFDIGWKANRRNVELLRQHLRKS